MIKGPCRVAQSNHTSQPCPQPLLLLQGFNLTPTDPAGGDDLFTQLSLAFYGKAGEIGRVRLSLKQTMEYHAVR
jgi:hypothetical protein